MVWNLIATHQNRHVWCRTFIKRGAVYHFICSSHVSMLVFVLVYDLVTEGLGWVLSDMHTSDLGLCLVS